VRTITDDTGVVISSTDYTATTVAATDYDPYGNRIAHTGALDSLIGYTGAWTDSV
jgi:YD repeat-containing protein